MNALAETEAETAAPGGRRVGVPSLLNLVANYNLVLILALLLALFAIVLPDTFPTQTNFQSIASDKATVGLAALAVMIPLAAGHFDLSVGYVIGVTHIVAIGFQVKSGIPWPLAIVLTLLVGSAIGAFNGWLVAVARIDSFIATLGSGTVVLGISYWYTAGLQVQGDLSPSFKHLATSKPLGIPTGALVVLAVAVLLWIVLEYRPAGRRLYALGANPRAAELVGIRPARYIVASFVASGMLAAVAGILLASRLQIGQNSVGPDYLLPAFVGALLGATSVRPGRVNPWGTVIAVAALAVGISGLQQLGASYFVEPLFNGGTLIIAVGAAGYAARRRLKRVAAGGRT